MSNPRGSEASDVRVLPLLREGGNRRVLVEWFDNHYDVVTAPGAAEDLDIQDVDLCVMDPANFEVYRDELIRQKAAQEPHILPYLLIRQEDTPLLDSDAKQYIDDVIVTPVSKRELARRVESLLRLRGLSLELERTNEQLEYFLNAAAHDLRNPLNIAKGYVAELEEKEPVSVIETALDRMEHLVEDFLTVSRTERDMHAGNLEPIEFTTLISECWEMVPTADADLEIDVREAVRIRAEPKLLRQLLENLVRNAIEHGTAPVSIRVGLLAGSDGFYLEDDGAGITEAERGSVFEEGYTTKEGSGLGLAIVKRVVDNHGWEVRVTEAELGGARFEFTGVETDP